MEMEHLETKVMEIERVCRETKLAQDLILARVEQTEKNLKKMQYVIITLIFALKAFFPNGLRSILDLFNNFQ